MNQGAIPSNVFGIYNSDVTTEDIIADEDIILKDQVLIGGYGELSEISGNLIIDNKNSATTSGQILLKTKQTGNTISTFAFDSCLHFPDGSTQCTAALPTQIISVTQPGTYDYTINPSFNFISMRCIGGGGGGGGGSCTNRLTTKDGLFGGAGGGGGGYSEASRHFTEGVNILQVVVGDGGQGGHTAISNGSDYSDYDKLSTKGQDGQITQILLNGTVILQAYGGKGGQGGYYTGDITIDHIEPSPGIGGYGNRSTGAAGGTCGKFNPKNYSSPYPIWSAPLPPTNGVTSAGYGGGGGGSSPVLYDVYETFDDYGGSSGGAVPISLGLDPNVSAAGGGSGGSALCQGDPSIQQVVGYPNGGAGGAGIQLASNFNGTVITPINGGSNAYLPIGGDAQTLGGGGGGGGLWNAGVTTSSCYFQGSNLPNYFYPDYCRGGNGGGGAAYITLSKV